MFSGEAPTVRRFVVQILAGLLAFRHLIVQVAMIKRLCAVLLASAGLFIDTRLVLLVVPFLVALVLAHEHLRCLMAPPAQQAIHGLLLRRATRDQADESGHDRDVSSRHV
jgi:hypothetical protein